MKVESEITQVSKLCLILLSLVGSVNATIFGKDDRIDIAQVKDDAIQRLSKSIPALILKTNLISIDENEYSIKGRDFVDSFNFCKDEKFVKTQKIVANCSAFLIGDDLVGTAAHCISPEMNMGIYDYAIVFDYKADSNGNAPKTILKENVYFIDKIVRDEFEWVTYKDYAVMKLTKAVVDRKPLVMSHGSRVEVGTPLFILGFPLGLPMKYQAQGKVNSVNDTPNSFRHHLDTYSVNSGSALFNAQTHEIVGIHVRGTGLNYYEDEKNKCNRWGLGDPTKDYGEANFIDIAL